MTECYVAVGGQHHTAIRCTRLDANLSLLYSDVDVSAVNQDKSMATALESVDGGRSDLATQRHVELAQRAGAVM